MSRYKSRTISLGTKRLVLIEKRYHSLMERVYTKYENVKCHRLKIKVKSKRKRKKIYKENGLDLEKYIEQGSWFNT